MLLAFQVTRESIRRRHHLLVGLVVSALPAQADWEDELAALRHDVQQQQQVIDRQSEQLASQQQRLDELADQQVSAIAADGQPVAGYDNGFFMQSPDASHRMRIKSWGQLRHNFFDSDGPQLDENDLELERLRLVFDGHVFNENFQYFFQLDADSDAGEVVDMLDYYVTYDFGHDMLCQDPGRLAIRLGKWKIGFNRAREESGTRMQFSDRSTASVLFDFDRSVGIGLLGNLEPEIGPVDWQVTVANGIDTGGFRTSRMGDLDRNFAFASRVNWLACGTWGNDGHADLQWRRLPAIRLGTGFTYSRREREGTREFNFPRVVDSGATIDTLLPAAVTGYRHLMYAADINLKYRGLSLIYEHYFRQLTDFSGASLPNLFDHGYWAELGYFVLPERVQLIARHARIVGDSGTLGSLEQSADEVAAGVVLYARGHDLKLTFDVTHLNGAPVSDSALNIRPGDRGWLYRTQFQWRF